MFQSERVRGILYQVLLLAAVVGVGWYLVSNTLHNLSTRQIQVGFGFLSREAGFEIAESHIAYDASNAYGRAFVVDADGVVLDRLPAREGSPEVVATGPRRDLQPGDRVDASALRAVEAFGAAQLRRAEMTPVAYEWSPRLGLVVVTKTGGRAVIGDAQQIDRKLATWAALLDQAGATGIKMSNIDLRFGASPAIRRS